MRIPLIRDCGGCTACCKTHLVSEIDKVQGVWCPHCEQGKGCAIYNNHPRECKDFACQWKYGFGQISHRPDRTNVVVDSAFIEPINMKVASLWEVEPGALDSEYAQRTLALLLKNEKMVALMHLSGLHILHVPAALDILPATRAVLERDGITIVFH